MIKFYFHPSPNPLKIALYLEETGEPYELIPVDTRKGEQHSDSFKVINPNAKKPDQVAILTREGCGFCAKAKALLAEKGYHYAEINLPHTERSRALGAIVGAKTVPQVFINGQHIGGWEDLEKWAAAK